MIPYQTKVKKIGATRYKEVWKKEENRFAGKTPEKELFFVQIKENLKTDRRYLMSVFPG